MYVLLHVHRPMDIAYIRAGTCLMLIMVNGTGGKHAALFEDSHELLPFG